MKKNSLYQRTIGWFILKARFAIGRTCNALRVPGFVRDCDLDSWIGKDHVAIRVTDGATVITVNGYDVFFDRVTGTMNAQGCRLNCTPASARQGRPAPA
jgi:hypothetical protein